MERGDGVLHIILNDKEGKQIKNNNPYEVLNIKCNALIISDGRTSSAQKRFIINDNTLKYTQGIPNATY